jgi:hypothetical protein
MHTITQVFLVNAERNKCLWPKVPENRESDRIA